MRLIVVVEIVVVAANECSPVQANAAARSTEVVTQAGRFPEPCDCKNCPDVPCAGSNLLVLETKCQLVPSETSCTTSSANTSTLAPWSSKLPVSSVSVKAPSNLSHTVVPDCLIVIVCIVVVPVMSKWLPSVPKAIEVPLATSAPFENRKSIG